MNQEAQVLQALEARALSKEELWEQLNTKMNAAELSNAIYQLSEQKYLIQKHPIIGGGCKTCACSISYVWRLTFSGRAELAKQKGT
jgi:hypothetical protein